jgi:hypothetical protein
MLHTSHDHEVPKISIHSFVSYSNKRHKIRENWIFELQSSIFSNLFLHFKNLIFLNLKLEFDIPK